MKYNSDGRKHNMLNIMLLFPVIVHNSASDDIIDCDENSVDVGIDEGLNTGFVSVTSCKDLKMNREKCQYYKHFK